MNFSNPNGSDSGYTLVLGLAHCRMQVLRHNFHLCREKKMRPIVQLQLSSWMCFEQSFRIFNLFRVRFERNKLDMALHFDPTDMDPICASLLKFKIQNRRPRCILMIGEVMMAMIFHFLLFVAGVGVVDGGSCSQDGQFLVTDRNWLCPNEERRPCDKKMHLFLKQHFLTRKPMPAVSRTAADEHGEWYAISFLERSTMPHLFLVAGTIVAGPFLNQLMKLEPTTNPHRLRSHKREDVPWVLGHLVFTWRQKCRNLVRAKSVRSFSAPDVRHQNAHEDLKGVTGPKWILMLHELKTLISCLMHLQIDFHDLFCKEASLQMAVWYPTACTCCTCIRTCWWSIPFEAPPESFTFVFFGKVSYWMSGRALETKH